MSLIPVWPIHHHLSGNNAATPGIGRIEHASHPQYFLASENARTHADPEQSPSRLLHRQAGRWLPEQGQETLLVVFHVPISVLDHRIRQPAAPVVLEE